MNEPERNALADELERLKRNADADGDTTAILLPLAKFEALIDALRAGEARKPTYVLAEDVRERCAKICDRAAIEHRKAAAGYSTPTRGLSSAHASNCDALAAAIRALKVPASAQVNEAEYNTRSAWQCQRCKEWLDLSIKVCPACNEKGSAPPADPSPAAREPKKELMQELKLAIYEANQMNNALCTGDQRWVMSVPAKRSDPDLVFARLANAASRALSDMTFAALTAERASGADDFDPDPVIRSADRLIRLTRLKAPALIIENEKKLLLQRLAAPQPDLAGKPVAEVFFAYQGQTKEYDCISALNGYVPKVGDKLALVSEKPKK